MRAITLALTIGAVLAIGIDTTHARRTGQKTKSEENSIRVIDSATIDEKPSLIVEGKVEYPLFDHKIAISGDVEITSRVTDTGLVDNVKIWKSSGLQSLDEAAVNAAKVCKYLPAIKDGKPVSCWIIRIYHFRPK